MNASSVDEAKEKAKGIVQIYEIWLTAKSYLPPSELNASSVKLKEHVPGESEMDSYQKDVFNMVANTKFLLSNSVKIIQSTGSSKQLLYLVKTLKLTKDTLSESPVNSS